MSDVRRVLHVLNYGWPHIDGYTVRSSGLITAQKKYLGLDVVVAVSPFTPFAQTRDESFATPAWHRDSQIAARRYGAPQHRGFERPGIGFSPRTNAEFRAELRSIVRRLEPDLLHVHHPHFVGSTAVSIAREFSLPCVYELRCFNGDYDLGEDHPYLRLRGRHYNRLELAVCRRADAVVTISKGLGERIVAGGVDRRRMFVVRNSVDTDLFSSPARVESRSGTLQIGYACTFSPMEGLDTLVEAVAALAPTLRAKLKLTLAGSGADYSRIKALVQKRNLEQTIALPGFVDFGEMPAFYRSLDLFVVPRRPSPVAMATTPLKPLEARASGLPMLVSDLPALRELLGQEATDVQYVKPDRNGLAAGLAQFIDAPWPGSASFDESRSWKQEVERYREVYASASKHAAVRPPKASATGRWRKSAEQRTKKILRIAIDNGWAGLKPLNRHVVICGFPRTGSTLLQLMIESCVDDVKTFDGEVEALWAAPWALRNHTHMLTKFPRDIGQVTAIREYYRHHTGAAQFVLMLRDPRAVLTSMHKAYPSDQGYYVSFERWQAIFERFRRIARDSDVAVVRYEDLVRDPDTVGTTLAETVGWNMRRPFAQYELYLDQKAHARDSMTEGALGGLRAVEASRISGWRQPQHLPRLRAMLEAIPDMPAHLIELGYEQDERWIDELP